MDVANTPGAGQLNDEILSLLQNRLSRSNGQAAQQGTGYSSGQQPAVTTTLSDDAKSLLTKIKGDQTVADYLQSVLAPGKSGAGTAGANSAQNTPANELNSAGAGSSADSVDVIQNATKDFDVDKMVDAVRRLKNGEGVAFGTKDMSEEQRLAFDAQKGLARKIVELEDTGRPEEAQALRTAIKDGTVKAQRTSDVPELNLNYSVESTHGGRGTQTSWQWNPMGDAKEALDSGRALAYGAVEHGAFYLSW